MKRILFITALLYSLAVGAQLKFNIMCSYEMCLNFGTPDFYDCKLYSSENNSLFIYRNITSSADSLRLTEELADNCLQVNITDDRTYNIFTDKDSIKSVSGIIGKEEMCVVIEERPVINWNITDETKKIDNYDCIKAVAEFRGRTYYAWFSPEIPMMYGPYKFHGLNGVIFEIYDQTREVSFRLKGFSFNNYTMPEIDYSGYPVMTQKEYISEFKSAFSEIGNRVASRMDNEFTIEVASPRIKSIELE